MAEMTALGAAMLAGHAVGVWPSLESIPLKTSADRFQPSMSDAGPCPCCSSLLSPTRSD